jgi:hypothetical protein
MCDILIEKESARDYFQNRTTFGQLKDPMMNPHGTEVLFN